MNNIENFGLSAYNKDRKHSIHRQLNDVDTVPDFRYQMYS